MDSTLARLRREEELYPGQGFDRLNLPDWNMEIEKAVEAANVIIVCLTKNSINKEGYVQRELRLVLDVALLNQKIRFL